MFQRDLEGIAVGIAVMAQDAISTGQPPVRIELALIREYRGDAPGLRLVVQLRKRRVDIPVLLQIAAVVSGVGELQHHIAWQTRSTVKVHS